MTKDDLYPITSDTTRDRSKTYYLASGCSFSEAKEDCFDANGEFFGPTDPFWDDWNGKGNYTYEEMESLGINKYHEKNEELAGDGEQGAAGGGSGGCGGGGGGCGGRANNQETKNKTKNSLNKVESLANAAKGASADLESLLKAVINLATGLFTLASTLEGLITPELLGQMTEMVDKTKEILSDAMESAAELADAVMNKLGIDVNSAMEIAMVGVDAAIAAETGDVQGLIDAAMDAANTQIGQSITGMAGDIAGKAADMVGLSGDVNSVIDNVMSGIGDTAASMLGTMGDSQSAIQGAMGGISDTIMSVMPESPARTAALSALASAQTSMSNAFSTSMGTIGTAYDVSRILGQNN